MPFPFDATVKELARQDPRGFLGQFVRVPPGPVSVLNIDLSTVSASADLAFGLGEPLEEVFHLEPQASAKESLHRDTLLYNVLLHRQHAVPVTSLLLLLRPQAAHSSQTGRHVYEGKVGGGRLEFTYASLRLWEMPVQSFLDGPLGTLPLAVLAQLPPGTSEREALAEVIGRVLQRLEREAPAEHQAKLGVSAYVLTGLRGPRDQFQELFQGARFMRESDTYQAILDEGALRERHEMLLELGTLRFGAPGEAERAQLLAIQDIERLRALTLRVVQADSWQELLA